MERDELIAKAKVIDTAFADFPKRMTLKRERMDRDIEIILVDFALTQPEEFVKRMGTRAMEKLLDLFEEINLT